MTTDFKPHIRAIWAEMNDTEGNLIIGLPDGKLPWPRHDADHAHLLESIKDRVLIAGVRTFKGLPNSWKSKAAFKRHPLILISSQERYWDANALLLDTGLSTQAVPVDSESHLDPANLVELLQSWPQFAGRDIAVIGGHKAWDYMAPVTDELSITWLPGELPYDATAIKAPVGSLYPHLSHSDFVILPEGNGAEVTTWSRA